VATVKDSARPFRRALVGYRRRDVAALVERRELELAALAHRVEELWDERERLLGELAELRARTEPVDEQARARAAAIVAAAEEEALTIRRKASERLQDATARVDSLLGLRDELLAELQDALGRYSSPPTPAKGRPRRDELAETRGSLTQVGEDEGGQLFARKLEVDAGPFDDFAELSSFERSLAALPSIEDVYIRSFDGSRAVVELTLSEERPLLHDLAIHVPYELNVRETSRGSIRLDVEHRTATV
jgi:hypothetical protein